MAKAKPKVVKVRVLADIKVENTDYRSGAFVGLPGKYVNGLKQAGVVDDSADAVEYCESEGIKYVEHVSEEAEQVAEAPPATDTGAGGSGDESAGENQGQ